MNDKRILRIIHTLDPTLGGPSNVIIDNSLALIKKGYSIHILTSDKKNKFHKYHKKIKIFNKGPSINNYGLNFRLLLWLYRNRKNYDFFIIHELWRFYTLLARIFLKNYYVFTHGQLDPFFKKNLLKRLKKQAYWFLIEKKNLIKSNSILLTSENEKKTLNNTYVKTDGINMNVIKYGIYKKKNNKKKISKAFYKKFKFLKNKKFYLFLGRFHEKKGCEIIIETIHRMKKNFKDIVLMAGPLCDSKYEKKIINLISKHKLQKKIIVSDMIIDDVKWGAIQESKAMILPSHGENFGVSLVESLSLAKPVLTTNKVNIFNEILKYDAGLISNNNTNSFKKIFLKFNKYNMKKINKMSLNAKKCFNDKFNLEYDKNNLTFL